MDYPIVNKNFKLFKSNFYQFSENPLNLALLADPTGFEPAISALTGQRVKPSYTTGPFSIFRHNYNNICQISQRMVLLTICQSLIFFLTKKFPNF